MLFRSKRYIAIVLSAVMVLSSFSFLAFADDEVSVDDAASEELVLEEAQDGPSIADVVSEAAADFVSDEESDISSEDVAPADPAEGEEGEGSEISALNISRVRNLNIGDSEELFADYAESVFYDSGTQVNKRSLAGNRLTGAYKEIYDTIVPELKKIADGERSSSVISYGGEITFTAQDLGLSGISEEPDSPNYHNKAAGIALGVILGKISDPIRLDCAYELYWNNSSIGINSRYSYSTSGATVTIKNMRFSFAADMVYRANSADETTIDTAKTGLVKQAAENASTIVKNAAGMSDYYKLLYYKDTICDLVNYDDDSYKANKADPDYFLTHYGAWALVHVFDEDPSTNVVCEGYSEAFQYLCELSSFDGDTYAYSVTGNLGGGTGAGGHKWNIVHIDGVNYIADITNSDSGTYGSDGCLFLKGMTKVSDATYKKVKSSTVTFTYDSDTIASYSAEQLAISTTDYVPSSSISVDDQVQFKGMSLTLSDDVAMKLYFDSMAGVTVPDMAVVSVSGDGIEDCDIDLDTCYDSHSGMYVLDIHMPAKNMMDSVTIQLILDGVPGATKSCSVRSYANAILAAGNSTYKASDKAMIKAMLNYGAYAQQYFGYNLDNLANSTVNNIVVEDNVPGSSVNLDGYAYNMSGRTKDLMIGASLVLSGKTSMKLYFEGQAGITGVSSTTSGIDVSLDTESAPGYQVVVIENINPSQLDSNINVKLSFGSVNETITVNPMAYGKKVMALPNRDSLKNLVKALYLYCKAAQAYNT